MCAIVAPLEASLPTSVDPRRIDCCPFGASFLGAHNILWIRPSSAGDLASVTPWTIVVIPVTSLEQEASIARGGGAGSSKSAPVNSFRRAGKLRRQQLYIESSSAREKGKGDVGGLRKTVLRTRQRRWDVPGRTWWSVGASPAKSRRERVALTAQALPALVQGSKTRTLRALQGVVWEIPSEGGVWAACHIA